MYTIDTIYSHAPRITESEALQALFLLQLSEDNGHAINQETIQRIIDEVSFPYN